MMILGVDVGLTGAVAVFDDDGTAIEVWDLPTMANGKKAARVKLQVNGGALARWLVARLTLGDTVPIDCVAFVEQQAPMPAQGVASVFSLGHSLGTITGVLAALTIPFVMVQPQEWKKHFKLAHAEKDVSRTVASRLFPTMHASLTRKKDHNRSEALLIAAYGVAQNNRRVA